MTDLLTLDDPATVARDRAAAIRTGLERMVNVYKPVLDLLLQAKDEQDHVTLGHVSWPAYLTSEFGGVLADLGREDRRSAAVLLSDAGMSTRAVGSLLGVSDGTVRNDRNRAHGSSGAQGYAPDEGAPPEVTGLDGKRYPTREPANQPEPRAVRKPPRRRPLPDQYNDAIYELGKVAERLERLTEDDRFETNRKAISDRNKGPLARAHKILFKCRTALNDGGAQ